ncbi:AI-2E family transporter [Mycetocola spongiae]|uniref:AI-2E family transporter n=1 Tax=Mycetocola spongiae TaxID=2859226 RepID=UPI001CF0F2F6|nr:AI-2E family transporter [Mycetocola spongiae]UCR89218.1 AI-2E family transporter [Mycetocola spongiae]
MQIKNAFRLGLIGTLGVGLGLLILFSIVQLQTILVYIGAALFLALGLDPVVSWLEKKSFPRWAAVLTVVFGALAVIGGLVAMVVPIVVDQISLLIARIPDIQRQLSNTDLVGYLNDQFPAIKFDEMLDQIAKFLLGNISNIGSQAILVAVGIGSFVVGSLVITILTIYFTASMPMMKRSSYLLVPASKRVRFAELSEQITDSVGRYVIGQIATASFNGVLSFIVLSIIGAPFPPVLASIAFFLSMIPLVGTLSGSIIITLICLIPTLGSPLTALAAGIYYLIYMQVEAYLISPRIMSRAVSVPGAVVVIAALSGGALLGLLGALIAIPTAAAIQMIIKQVLIPRQNLK